MLTFFGCVGLLIAGYFTYGRLVERIFGIDPKRRTPALELADGIDYIAMPTWKVFLIQLLDIAGIGPIFGPILGALYGPVALLWIVIGCVFAGSVHDFFSGMLSLRHKGESIPEVVGDALGKPARYMMRIFSLMLLLPVGVVFVLSPAKLLTSLTGWPVYLFVGLIFCYYFVATIMPIDKIIGLVYPVLGGLLLIMTVGILWGLIYNGYELIPNLDVATNIHPAKKPIWPLLFVTLSCGAISGFHSTQSPIMARCLKNEKNGRLIFYGAMIVEGIIALIWATVGLSFYPAAEKLQQVIMVDSPAAVVYNSSFALLGPIAGFCTVLGVIVLPISSGDTAFRSSRFIISEALKLDQKKISRRLLVAVPLFAAGILIATQNYDGIWRYAGWANQVLAALVLWSGAIFLIKQQKAHWICTLPALFVTAVAVTFILNVSYGFNLSIKTATWLGIVMTLMIFVVFIIYNRSPRTQAVGDVDFSMENSG